MGCQRRLIRDHVLRIPCNVQLSMFAGGKTYRRKEREDWSNIAEGRVANSGTLIVEAHTFGDSSPPPSRCAASRGCHFAG